jgi:hypothetical protein
MLKFETETVPEGLESYYTKNEETGTFRLQVEGVVPELEFKSVKEKVNAFRNDNITLKKQLEAFADFEAVVGADGKVTKDGVKSTIETLVQNRVSQMKQTLEAQISEREEALRKTNSRLEDVLIADAVKAAAMNHAVVPTAIDDVLARARRQFKVEEGKVVSVNSSGDSSGQPLTIESFVAGLKQNASHLFAKSEGTGTFNRSRNAVPAANEQSRNARLAGFLKK